MHGLQVWQSAYANNIHNTGGVRSTHPMIPDNPPSLQAATGTTGAGDTQYYINRVSMQTRFFNQGPNPIVFKWTVMRWKHDIPQVGPVNSISSALNDDAPVVTASPLFSYTTSNTAQKLMKFVKTKSKVLYPGRMFTIRWSKKYPSRPVTPEVEMNGTQWAYRKGNTVIFVTMEGAPFTNYLDSGSGTGATTGTSAFHVAWNEHIYISYYNMSISTPASTGDEDIAPFGDLSLEQRTQTTANATRYTNSVPQVNAILSDVVP